jgi:hypothetical protein
MVDYLKSIDMPIYMGKETLNFGEKSSFFELSYVKKVLEGISDDEIHANLSPFVLNCVHGDNVSIAPQTFKDDSLFAHQASSERTQNELWTYGEKILSM